MPSFYDAAIKVFVAILMTLVSVPFIANIVDVLWHRRPKPMTPPRFVSSIEERERMLRPFDRIFWRLVMSALVAGFCLGLFVSSLINWYGHDAVVDAYQQRHWRDQTTIERQAESVDMCNTFLDTLFPNHAALPTH